MILAVYVIGSLVAIVVLTARLGETRDELARVRRERDAFYAKAIRVAVHTRPPADAAMPVEEYGPPGLAAPAQTASQADGRRGR